MRRSRRLAGFLVFGLMLTALVGCSLIPVPSGSDVELLRVRVQAMDSRLQTIESAQGQLKRVLDRARAATAYVWGTDTFVDPAGRTLRHVLNEAGEPTADAQGVPLVGVTGTGTVAVTNYCGTAFLVGRTGELLTNRHVAEPWWEDDTSAPLLAAGFRPVFLRLRAFFQEHATGVPIEVLRVDSDQDIALVRTTGWAPTTEPMPLHPDPDALEDGQPVMLIGFPTGLDAIMAKLETPERVAIESATGACSYASAERLAELRRLRPTVTGGFLWEALPHIVVYDARTKEGGSGGPLLDREGRVIGVNAAYLPEFQGGNYGVPIRFGRLLLEGGGIVANAPARETPELVAEPLAPNEAPIASCTAERSAQGEQR